MIAPSAMIIEAAADSLKDEDFLQEHDTILKEQAAAVRSAFPNKSEDFYDGYALGLMTARVLLRGMPNAVFQEITL
jgi:hypothetical protein